MNHAQKHLLKDIKALLSYHNNIGITEYALQNQGADFIRKSGLIHVLPEVEVSNVEVTDHEAVTASSNSIQEIANDVMVCTSCGLRQNRLIPVPGRGGDLVKILFIGGWLSSAGDQQLLEDTVFGIEEDKMIARMLTAINLNKEDAFVTNIIKCGIPDAVQPGAQNIQSCSSYLHRQIGALSPQIICTMGIIATRVFINISRPLSQLRGRFYSYTTLEKKELPVLPTYHPTFLLQNPEMKKATWVDLQLMEKELKKKRFS